MAEERVARDREEEREKGGVLTQAGSGLRELDPGLLREVFGGVPASAEAEQERKYARMVCRIHAIERRDVAPPEALYEVAVVAHIHENA